MRMNRWPSINTLRYFIKFFRSGKRWVNLIIANTKLSSHVSTETLREVSQRRPMFAMKVDGPLRLFCCACVTRHRWLLDLSFAFDNWPQNFLCGFYWLSILINKITSCWRVTLNCPTLKRKLLLLFFIIFRFVRNFDFHFAFIWWIFYYDFLLLWVLLLF